MSEIIKDSSIWDSDYAYEVAKKKDMAIRVGIVRDAKVDDPNDDVFYIVEVFDTQNQVPVYCRRMERFGGVYNYEEFTHRGYTHSDADVSASKYAIRAGDVVVVAYIRGDSREGIILGSIKHPSRARQTQEASDVLYISEFNGLETSINVDGEYKVTFKGIPTNQHELTDPPDGNDIPAPTYDLAVGSSYYQFDKTGSWTVTDNAQENPQSIKIDKPGGITTIISGQVSITIDKNAQSIVTEAVDTTLNSSNSITDKTETYDITADTKYTMRSPKIAIGHSGTELLDQITKLIDAIGQLTIITPMGPASAANTAPQWPQVDAVKEAINEIKGSL